MTFSLLLCASWQGERKCDNITLNTKRMGIKQLQYFASVTLFYLHKVYRALSNPRKQYQSNPHGCFIDIKNL